MRSKTEDFSIGLTIVALASLVGTMAAAGGATAQHLVEELTTRPSIPTWQERVQFTATGTASLFEGIEVVEVAAPLVRVHPVPYPAPIDPPAFERYEYSVMLPQLDPGQWTVVYEQRNGTELGRVDFEVFAIGDVAIEAVRSGPTPTDVTLRVSGYACGEFELSGELTEFVYRTQTVCDSGGVPLAPEYFEFEELVSTFPLGETIRGAVQVDLSPQKSVVAVTTFEVSQLEGDVPSLCDVSDPTFLCLGDGGRFRATLEVVDGPGEPLARPFPPPAGNLYSSTGFFSIFDADNLEATIKVLDGCAINGHFWLFVSWGTTLRLELSVDDLETGRQYLADTPGYGLAPPWADVKAFPCSV